MGKNSAEITAHNVPYIIVLIKARIYTWCTTAVESGTRYAPYRPGT